MDLKELIKVNLNKNQLKALTSLVEDIGIVLFQNSTLLKKINQGDLAVGEEFLRWQIRNGRKDPDMLLKRQSEITLFTK